MWIINDSVRFVYKKKKYLAHEGEKLKLTGWVKCQHFKLFCSIFIHKKEQHINFQKKLFILHYFHFRLDDYKIWSWSYKHTYGICTYVHIPTYVDICFLLLFPFLSSVFYLSNRRFGSLKRYDVHDTNLLSTGDKSNPICIV